MPPASVPGRILSGGGRVRCASACALKPRTLGEARTARPALHLFALPSASSSPAGYGPRARGATADLVHFFTSTRTKSSLLAPRTRPRRLPADIFCRTFTERAL